MKKFIRIFFALSLFILISSNAFADDTSPAPYEKNEFPQWAYDLRRAEIITLGSMPFVTIGVTLGYGAFLKARGEINSFPNPFSSSSGVLSSDQTRNIFIMSIGISTVYGLTDFLINHFKRKNADEKKAIIENAKSQARIERVTVEEAAALLNESMARQKEEEQNANQSEEVTSQTENTDSLTNQIEQNQESSVEIKK